MPVEITPRGTRGANIPKLPRPLAKAAAGLMAGFMRLRGAKPTPFRGIHLLLLTTVGAKSGRPHTVPLGWVPDGDDAWLIVASSSGAATHPAWYHNMAKNPDKIWIEIGKRKLRVHAESLKGPEREEAWRRIVSVAPYYGDYQHKTDREIPVVRLTPAPPPAS